jgi:hypothetical protein
MLKGVLVQVDSTVNLTITMVPGTASAIVTVNANETTIDLANATVGTIVSRREIEDLPLNGQNALALTLFAENVRSGSSGSNGNYDLSGFGDRGGVVTQVSINGGPSAANGNTLDGQNNLQTYTGEVSINPGSDSIREFKIQFGAMPAENGFTLGGVVNQATRSGSNQYHGSVFEFLRNDALNAKGYFTGTGAIPRLRYNQYGGSVGGPIRRDKMQFFSDYEEFRFYSESVVFATVPTAAQRCGDFSSFLGGITNAVYTPGAACPNIPPVSCGTSGTKLYDPTTTRTVNGKTVRDPFPCDYFGASRRDPVAVAIQDAAYPYPNYTPGPNDPSGNYKGLSSNNRTMRRFLERVDTRISDRQSGYVRYAYYGYYTDNGGMRFVTPGLGLRYDHLQTHSLLLSHTLVISSNLLNEFKIAANRTTFPFQDPTANQNWPQKLGFPANVPETTFPGITNNGAPVFGTGTVGFRAATQFQLLDTVSRIVGRHTMRMGVDFRIDRGDNYQTSAPSGNFSFSATATNNPQSTSGTGWAYASYLLGAVTSATASTTRGETDRNYTLSLFFDDLYRVTPHLTLDMGLRYDYQPSPVEQNNGYSSFNPNITSSVSGLLGAMQYAGVNGAQRSFVGNDATDFGPRLGFGWDVLGNGKLSMRGGGGIYYQNSFNQLFLGDTNGFASTITTYNSGDANYPVSYLSKGLPTPPIQPRGASLGPDGFLGTTANYTPSYGIIPRSTQWDLSLQYQLPAKVLVEAAYAGNHGTHIIAGSYNLNTLNPSYYSLGNSLQDQVANPYAGKVPGSLGNAKVSRLQTLLPYPYYGAITVRNPRDGDYTNNALVLKMRKTSSNGLTAIGTYTKAKLIDQSIQPASSISAASWVSTQTYQNIYDRGAERSLDSNDISQRATFGLVYPLPIGRGRRFLATSNGLVDAIVGGWQLNSTGILQTGRPLAITMSTSVQSVNSPATRPDFVAGVSPKATNRTVRNWFNQAAFISPTMDPTRGPVPFSYRFGNVPRTLPDLRGPGFIGFDMSAFKTFILYHELHMEMRVEAFNVLNHTNFTQPNQSFNPGTNGLAGPNPDTGSVGFGGISSATPARAVQISARILF